MKSKHTVIISSLALALAASGCTDRPEEESSVIDKATHSETIVTATTTPTTIAPVEVEVPERKSRTREAIEGPSEAEEAFEKTPPFTTELRPSDGLAIQRFVTTSSVEKREPTAVGAVFRSSEERVYAFIEASNESSSPKTLLVYFLGPDEQVSGGIELEIPASVPRWRTWAYTRHAKEPGLWRVEIRDTDGVLVGAVPFEVEADD